MNASTFLLFVNQHQTILGRASNPSHALSYDPYGYDPTLNAAHSSLGFNAQLRQPSTGFYSLGNGYRTYNPALRCFHSPDSWSPFGAGGINAYRYCQGDPVNSTDPSGHKPGKKARLFPRLNPYEGPPASTSNAASTRASQAIATEPLPSTSANPPTLASMHLVPGTPESQIATLYYEAIAAPLSSTDSNVRSARAFISVGESLEASNQGDAASTAFTVASRFSPITLHTHLPRSVAPAQLRALESNARNLTEISDLRAFVLIGAAIRN